MLRQRRRGLQQRLRSRRRGRRFFRRHRQLTRKTTRKVTATVPRVAVIRRRRRTPSGNVPRKQRLYLRTLLRLRRAERRRQQTQRHRRRRLQHQRQAHRRLKRINWQSLGMRSKATLRLRRRRRFNRSNRPRAAVTPEGRPLRREYRAKGPAPDLPTTSPARQLQTTLFGKGRRWTAPRVQGGCLYLRGSWRRLWVTRHPRLGRRVLLGHRWRTRRWRRVRYH